MSANINNDARNIRKLIRETEALSDELIIACAKLRQAMVQARQNPDVFMSTGQKALVRLAEAESNAVSLSSNLFRVHDELNEVARVQAGLDEGFITERPKKRPSAKLADADTSAPASA